MVKKKVGSNLEKINNRVAVFLRIFSIGFILMIWLNFFLTLNQLRAANVSDQWFFYQCLGLTISIIFVNILLLKKKEGADYHKLFLFDTVLLSIVLLIVIVFFVLNIDVLVNLISTM